MATKDELKYKLIDIPVKTQAGIPNPENYSSEAEMYADLQFIVARRGVKRLDTGREIWTSPSSGIKYDTNDEKWKAYSNIYNRGKEGLMNLLNFLYSDPTNGKAFIATAKTFNDLANTVDKIINGAITVKNATYLNGHPDSYFATKVDINNIVSGTTTVGNADKVDGFHASYFAKATDISSLNLQLQNIINGKTEVGLAKRAKNADNANTVGGHSASYFQPASSALKAYSGTGVPSSGLGKNGDLYLQII